MTYIPTEQELTDMVFIKPQFKDYFEFKITPVNTIRWYDKDTYRKTTPSFFLTNDDWEYLNTIKFYPTSKQDIESILRLFSPQ